MLGAVPAWQPTQQQRFSAEDTNVFPTRVVTRAQDKGPFIAKASGRSFKQFVSEPQQQKCRLCCPCSEQSGKIARKGRGRGRGFQGLLLSRTCCWVSLRVSLTCVLLPGNGLASVSPPWTWPGCRGCRMARWAGSTSGSWRTM